MYKSVLQRPCEDTLHEDGSGGGRSQMRCIYTNYNDV